VIMIVYNRLLIEELIYKKKRCSNGFIDEW
jgi:hypothetical protein